MKLIKTIVTNTIIPYLGACGLHGIFDKRVLAMTIRGIRIRIKWRGTRDAVE